MERLDQQFAFLREIDREKEIVRQTLSGRWEPEGGGRRARMASGHYGASAQ